MATWHHVDVHGDRLVAATSHTVRTFVHDGVTWQEEQTITPVDLTSAVTLGAEILVIASSEANDEGAAFVYYLIDGSWEQRVVLTGADTEGDDLFGASVDMEDNFLIVGAPGDRHDGTNASGERYKSSGAAYVFELR
jgi:hypothetical protein